MNEFKETLNVGTGCEDGWKYFHGTNSCYKVFNSAKTWEEAKRICQKQVADLASVTDSETNEFLTSLTSTNSWIGAYKDSSGNWRWSDGSRWKYTSWGKWQPNNWSGYQDRATINYGEVGKWDDAAKDNKNPFICKTRYLYKNCGLGGGNLVLPTINNGKEVVPHTYPWQVWIYDDETGEMCGGSIITHEHILTAAHCVYNKESHDTK